MLLDEVVKIITRVNREIEVLKLLPNWCIGDRLRNLNLSLFRPYFKKRKSRGPFNWNRQQIMHGKQLLLLSMDFIRAVLTEMILAVKTFYCCCGLTTLSTVYLVYSLSIVKLCYPSGEYIFLKSAKSLYEKSSSQVSV